MLGAQRGPGTQSTRRSCYHAWTGPNWLENGGPKGDRLRLFLQVPSTRWVLTRCALVTVTHGPPGAPPCYSK